MARKATFLLALIWMASPVAGLWPMGGALADLEDAEPDDADTLALFQVLVIIVIRSPASWTVLLLGDGRGEVLEGDGG